MFKRLGAFFLDIIEVVVFAIAIFLFIYLLVLQPHKIKGSSMEPNYPNGEYLLTDKVTYRLREPERGDVIVFKSPTAEGDEFIKRIIGLPNEVISIKNGVTYINGARLDETYIPINTITQAGQFINEGQEIKIPEGSYIVFGDNRNFSSDSRSWGYIKKDEITGRAWLVYWPIPQARIIKDIQYSF